MQYLFVTFLALLMGQFSGYLGVNLPKIVEKEKEISLFFKMFKNKFKIDFIFSIIYILLFNMSIYLLGTSIQTYIYLFVFVILSVIFFVDLKTKLIPDTMQLFLFIFAIINIGLNFEKIFIFSSFLGLVFGGGSFLLISVISRIIYRKEGMGFGDVKFMAILGLIFGLEKIITITVLSFFLAAIFSIFILIFKNKDLKSYIAFGPFISMATVLVTIIGTNFFIITYVNFCTKLGMYFTDFLFKIIY